MNKPSLTTILRLTPKVLRHLAIVVTAGRSRGLELQLAATPAGRVVLHLLCAWRDHRIEWHWRGVTRELARF